MKQIPGFNLYTAHGSEIPGPRPLPLPDGWYICTADNNSGLRSGGPMTTVAGPFRSEALARSVANAMTDTSGT